MKKIPFKPPSIEHFYGGTESKEDLENSLAELQKKVDLIDKLHEAFCVIFIFFSLLFHIWIMDKFSPKIGGFYLVILFGHFALIVYLAFFTDNFAFSRLDKREQALFKDLSSDLQKINEFEIAKVDYDILVAAFMSETSEFYWKQYKGIELEKKIAEMLQRVGYKVDFTPAVGDGGVDLRVQDDQGRLNIQVKGHSKNLGVGAIRDAAGVLATERVPMVVVAPMGFTSGAIDFADKSGVSLWDAYELTKIASQHPVN